MNIVTWLVSTLGLPTTSQFLWLYYILGGVVLLILLDGLITFLLGAITSLTSRGR